MVLAYSVPEQIVNREPIL